MSRYRVFIDCLDRAGFHIKTTWHGQAESNDEAVTSALRDAHSNGWVIDKVIKVQKKNDAMGAAA